MNTTIKLGKDYDSHKNKNMSESEMFRYLVKKLSGNRDKASELWSFLHRVSQYMESQNFSLELTFTERDCTIETKRHSESPISFSCRLTYEALIKGLKDSQEAVLGITGVAMKKSMRATPTLTIMGNWKLFLDRVIFFCDRPLYHQQLRFLTQGPISSFDLDEDGGVLTFGSKSFSFNIQAGDLARIKSPEKAILFWECYREASQRLNTESEKAIDIFIKRLSRETLRVKSPWKGV